MDEDIPLVYTRNIHYLNILVLEALCISIFEYKNLNSIRFRKKYGFDRIN